MASVQYKLTYFDGRGLAEVARIILAFSGANWEDNRLPIEFKPDGNHVRPEFDALKASGKLPFGQVPLLEVTGQSHVLAQSRAIEFYLSQQHGLLGADAFQTAVIHSFVEGLGDLRTEYAKANWWAKAEDKEALGAKFFAEHLPKHYGLLEKNVVATDALHLGDIILFVLNDVFVASGKVPEGFLDAYPSLVARINKVKADPKISAYLANRKVTPF